MSFTSFTFPVFFLVVWAIYLCLKHRPQNAFLLAASYAFYGWFDWRFLVLLLTTTTLNYLLARGMEGCGEQRPRAKKALIVAALIVNLGVLGFFKYFNFFAASLEQSVAPLGLKADFITLNVLLPFGLSFFTFQATAYAIDVYRGKIAAVKNFLDFSLFIAYFPHIASGPIARAAQLMPQIVKPRSIDRAMINSAAQLILMGYFKKVFIADGVAPIVEECLKTPDQFGGVTLFVATFLFSFQVYGDFSGYTDIARGVSRLFGIELMLNFRQPFLSKNVADFWNRWHISLSSWFGDYVYNPLYKKLMSRKGYVNRTMSRKNYVFLWMYVSLMITMALCGLWHGASMNFVVFGTIQGALMCIHASIRANRIFFRQNPSTLWKISFGGVSMLLTFSCLSLARIFFRSETCADACGYFYHIAQGGTAGIETVGLYVVFYGFWLFLIDVLCYWQDSEVPFTARWWSPVRGMAYGVLLFLLVFIGENDIKPFIYFQF